MHSAARRSAFPKLDAALARKLPSTPRRYRLVELLRRSGNPVAAIASCE
jgi:hypothetical protein